MQDYEPPRDENTAYFIKDSFRNSAEKKECFHKLLKIYQDLLLKRDSMKFQKDVTDGYADIMRINEITELIQTSFTQSSLEKAEELLTQSERKMMYMNIKR